MRRKPLSALRSPATTPSCPKTQPNRKHSAFRRLRLSCAVDYHRPHEQSPPLAAASHHRRWLDQSASARRHEPMQPDHLLDAMHVSPPGAHKPLLWVLVNPRGWGQSTVRRRADSVSVRWTSLGELRWTRLPEPGGPSAIRCCYATARRPGAESMSTNTIIVEEEDLPRERKISLNVSLLLFITSPRVIS